MLIVSGTLVKEMSSIFRNITSKGHTGGSLDVIVEGAVLVPVLLQEPESVLVAEILELDEGVLAIAPNNCLSKTVLEDDRYCWSLFTCMNSSMKSSYLSPVTLRCLSPM